MGLIYEPLNQNFFATMLFPLPHRKANENLDTIRVDNW